MNISCDMIFDLIPLVKDGIASDDSIKIVHDHIKSCDHCKAEFETFETIDMGSTSIEDEKLIRTIKRSIFMTQFIILIAGAIIGVALSNSMDMFYNLLIMPIIGGVSLIALKKKWYLTPIGIFVLTYIWQTVIVIVSDGFYWSDLCIGLYYSIIYAALVGLGTVIVMLIKFAFKRES